MALAVVIQAEVLHVLAAALVRATQIAVLAPLLFGHVTQFRVTLTHVAGDSVACGLHVMATFVVLDTGGLFLQLLVLTHGEELELVVRVVLRRRAQLRFRVALTALVLPALYVRVLQQACDTGAVLVRRHAVLALAVSLAREHLT